MIPIQSFTGTAHILITGIGSAQLYKSIDRGESYYPVTDAAGDYVVFENDDPEGALFNAEISNSSHAVKYALKAEGEIKVEVAR